VTVLALLVLVGVCGVVALVTANLRVHYRPAPAPSTGPSVSILIPARNEAAHIDGAVRAACAQAGDVEVIVLDDASTDATPEILRRLSGEEPRLRVVQGAPMPEGWAGKSWACWQLSAHALNRWLLFVDADVRLAPDAAGRAVAAAESQGVEFLSGVPRQRTGTVGEALLVPLIHLQLLAWLPMGLIRRRPEPALSAGCGQFMLARWLSYLAAGGHRAVRASRHDGIMLARRFKAAGLPVGLFDATDVATCRMYEGLVATWRGFARNAYEAFGSPGALAAMATLNAAVFVLPFVALPWTLAVEGVSLAAGIWSAAVAVVVALRWRLAARFAHPRWTALATPLAVLMMLAIQVHSFVNHSTRRRVVWRGRAYGPPPAAPQERTTV
jgi:hypothetical protein